MKIKNILYLICFIYSTGLFGQQYRCYIKTNPQECANCINGGKVSLDAIDKKLMPTFVFEEIYEDQIPRFFKDILQIQWNPEYIIISDSLHKKLTTTNASEVHIVDENGKSLFKCDFKDLQSNLEKINSYKVLDIETIVDIPDSIVFSRTTQIILGNEHLVLHDYQFNDIYFVDLKKRQLEQRVSGNDVDLEQLMKLYFERDYEYDLLQKNIDLMRQMGKDKIKFEVVWNQSDTFYTIVTIPHLIIEVNDGKHDAIIDQVYMILTWHNGDIIMQYPVEHLKSNKYDIDQGGDFFKKDNQFYLSIFKDDLRGKTPFLATFDVADNNRVSFSKRNKQNLPKFYKEMGWEYVSVDFYECNNHLFFKYCDDVLALNNTSRHKIGIGKLFKEEEKRNKYLYTLWGVLKEKELYHIIYTYDDVFYASKLHEHDFSIQEKRIIPVLKREQYKSDFKLIEKDKILVVSSSNDIISINLK